MLRETHMPLPRAFFAGPIGIVLPLAIALSMYANIDAAFSLPARASGSHPNPMMAYVMEKIRLLLEWAVVPLFVVSLQLPQGALCYWATSSAFALAQNHALKVPLVRAAAGLPTGQLRPLPSSSTSTSASTSESKQRFSKNVPPAAQQMAAEAEDVDRALAPLFAQAAEQQARGNGIAAEKVLKRILDQSPMHPRALFALGQVQSGLREWAAAAESYLEATRCEGDPMQRCRAWFGVGVALHMKGDEEGAVEAFSRAAGPEASEQLRVRAWVAAAQLELKLGRREAAIGLLRMAAKVEPKVEEVYLRPLLAGEGPGSER